MDAISARFAHWYGHSPNGYWFHWSAIGLNLALLIWNCLGAAENPLLYSVLATVNIGGVFISTRGYGFWVAMRQHRELTEAWRQLHEESQRFRAHVEIVHARLTAVQSQQPE